MLFRISCDGFQETFEASNVHSGKLEFFRFCCSRLGDSLNRFHLSAYLEDFGQWIHVCDYDEFLRLVNETINYLEEIS